MARVDPPIAGGGWLSIARPAEFGAGVVDSLTCGSPVANATLSAVPEGQSFTRLWVVPTPGQPNPAPMIAAPVLEAAKTADSFVIRWMGEPGVRYRLESVDALSGVWQPVDRVIGSSGRIELQESPAGASTRFYRVVAEP